MSPVADALRARLAALRVVVGDHPRHVVLFALVAGLLAGAWAPVVLVPGAAVAALAAGRGPVALLAVVAVLGGSVLAQARVRAIERGPLPAAIGTDVAIDVVLLEPLRERASGRLVARVSPRDGPAAGEALVLRLRDASGLVAGQHGSAAGSDDGGPRAPIAAGNAAVWTGAGPGDGSATGGRAAAADGDAAGTRAVARTDVGPGDVLAVTGRLEALGPWDAYQRRRGALAGIEAERAVVTAERRGGVAGVLDGVRRRAEAAMARRLPDSQAALLLGMTLGRDDGIDEATQDAFRASGLAHLLAVSGQNVMLLCILALALMGVVGVPLRARLLVALLLVALYVPLTGAGASIQRAGVMGACGLVAALAGRPSSRWYALGFAAAATLLLNPLAAADPGWQLSFAAVVGLLSLTPPLRAGLIRRRVPTPLAEAFALTFAATLATAPLLAVHFEQVSLTSLPANLAAAPVVAPIMWLGMLAAAAGQLAPGLAAPLTTLAAPLLGFVGWIAERAAALPGATVAIGLPGPAGVALAYAALVAVCLAVRHALPPGWSPPRGPAVALVTAVLLGLAAARTGTGVAPAPPGQTVVTFLDVGQGDATLIQRGGTAMLVDTGTPDGDVVARVREVGVERLDLLALTHAEHDHEGAAPAVIRALRPRVVLNGGAGWSSPVQAMLPALARQAGSRIVTAAEGDELRAGPIALDVLWPPQRLAEAPPAGSANDRALVMTASAGGLDVLLTGDAEAEVTTGLDWPEVDVLKVSHHGSDDAGLPALLDAAEPAVAAIPVGENSYGHPTPDTLAALQDAVPHVFRTDRGGGVRLFGAADGAIRVQRIRTPSR